MMALWGYQLQKHLNNIKIIIVRQTSIPKPPFKERKKRFALGVKICLNPKRLTLTTSVITKSVLFHLATTFGTLNCKWLYQNDHPVSNVNLIN